MSDINVHLPAIELYSVLSPVVSAQIVTAYYLALLLKKTSGIEITPEVEELTQAEVETQWTAFLRKYENILENVRLQKPQQSSGPEPDIP